MPKKTIKLIVTLFLITAGVFIVDQYIKMLFVDGLRYYTECIDLILVYNRGVAFSMFSFLDEWLKYIQIVLVFGILIYIISLKKLCFAVPAGLLLGGAISNIYDRFIHGGVVDMVYWHCGFDFAVFNFADVMIDVAVVWFLILNFKPKLCKS
ncbi:MAG: signal peptidase II [Sulfurimonas sp.]|nr:signal peptidase II [Sulfurimonas sp.]MDD3835446.1 signal peptidase II [Sulfurimonas sp.]